MKMRKISTVFLALLTGLLLPAVPATADEAGWPGAYTEILKTAKDSGNAAGFLLYDIDKEGTPELIIKTGSNEADSAGTAYTCANGAAVEIGEFGLGHTGMYSDPDENGILLWTAHMGAASLFRYSLKDGQLVSEEVSEETLDIQNDPNADYTPVEDYVSGAKYLELYDVSSDPKAVYDETLNILASETMLLSVRDAGEQLNLIFSGLDGLRQDSSEMVWQYAVTDLDRNGRLEFLAVSEHEQNHDTALLAWEVSEDGTALEPCEVNPTDNGSFPDIISESADTFFDEGAGTWHYLCYDRTFIGDEEAFTAKDSYTFRNGSFSSKEYAVQHVVIAGGETAVTFSDPEGNEISEDDYNDAGVDAFGGRRRSSTNFEWLQEDGLTLQQLTESYAVFCGERPVPNVIQAEGTQPAPAAQPEPAPNTPFLMIVDQPTNEYHNAGETAWFVATANVWDSLAWTFVGPNGAEYSVSDMGRYFPYSSIGGADGTTLSISNVTADMNGYGAYCTFWYNGQTVTSSTAWLYVAPDPAPTPTPVEGSESGTIIDALMSTVTIMLDDGTEVQVLRDICTVDGDLDIGCRCDVYYEGYGISSDTVYYVYIYGTEPAPEPVYGSMDGTVIDAMMSTITIQLSNGDVVQPLMDYVNLIGESLQVGCSCTVYYNGDYPSTDSIYAVDVYGWDIDYNDDGGYEDDYEGDYEDDYDYAYEEDYSED